MNNQSDVKTKQVELDLSNKSGEATEAFLLKPLDPTTPPNVTRRERFTKCLNSLKGYSYGLLFAVFTCMANVFVKMAPTLDGSNHALMRYTIQFSLMVAFIWRKKLEFFGPKKNRKLLVLRGFVGCSAGILAFFSIKYLDVSDVETITNSCVLLTALLARVFLKEKLTVCHMFAFVLTLTGVLFIIRPEFLFGIEVELEDYFHVNLTQHNLNINQTYVDSHGHVMNLTILNHSTRKFNESIFGVTLVLLSALSMSIAQVSIRKLSLAKIHFSVISMYPALIGLPSSLLLSLVLILTKSSHSNLEEETEILPIQFLYSFIAGCLATLSLICLNLALKLEDASKIGMLKTSGVFLSFILQYLFLDVEVDFLGVFGAMCIITGTISIILTKLVQQKFSKSTNCFIKILLIQF